MAANERGLPVEDFRLTRKQLGFQKRFQRFMETKSILEARTMENYRQTRNLSELWKELQRQGTFLQMIEPKEKVHTLPEMDFGDEDEEAQNASPEQLAMMQGKTPALNY